MAMKGARSLLGKALVLIEHNNAKVSPASLSAITAASKFGDITALVAGKGCAPVAEQASKIAGVKAVVQVDSAEYDHLLPENVSKLVEKLHGAEKFSHIVAAHTAFGKSVIPRVAAVSDCQPIPDVINVVDENTFVRPTYAGNALATVKSEIDPVKMLTIRPTSFDKAGDGGSAAVTNGEACGETGGTKWVSDEVDDSGKPDLSSARVVVGGGRGLKSGENFKLLFDLADKIPNCAGAVQRARLREERSLGTGFRTYMSTVPKRSFFCSWRNTCCRGCWLRSQRTPSWTDWQSCCPRFVHRHGLVWCNPASGWHEGQQGHRLCQHGP
uniref:Electron transfer flavoprotein alpha/beta-subunit N-terminal domain-containing protein n=1 Tax=Eutreptiella gymnastica TaxID=73025 RepID=A0A7S4FQL1_9EUGL